MPTINVIAKNDLNCITGFGTSHRQIDPSANCLQGPDLGQIKTFRKYFQLKLTLIPKSLMNSRAEKVKWHFSGISTYFSNLYFYPPKFYRKFGINWYNYTFPKNVFTYSSYRGSSYRLVKTLKNYIIKVYYIIIFDLKSSQYLT